MKKPALALAASLLFLPALLSSDRSAAERKEIDDFNQRFDHAIMSMDNDAVMSLWAADGIDMKPGQAPTQGKAAITAWLHGVTSKMKGYKMTAYHSEYHIITMDKQTASEWATTHQTIQTPDGGKPLEADGKMVLILRKEKDGWKIVAEMWEQ